MIDYSEQIAKELEYNFNDNRRYQTIIFLVDVPTIMIPIKEIQEFICKLRKYLSEKNIPFEAIDFLTINEKRLYGEAEASFNELIEWIKEKAKTPKRCILIYEIDSLLSTWNTHNAKSFFRKILYHDGIQMPVLLISYIAMGFSLPTEKSGQGLVIKQKNGEDL